MITGLIMNFAPDSQSSRVETLDVLNADPPARAHRVKDSYSAVTHSICAGFVKIKLPPAKPGV